MNTSQNISKWKRELTTKKKWAKSKNKKKKKEKKTNTKTKQDNNNTKYNIIGHTRRLTI